MDELFNRLSKSKFRSSFKLKEKDFNYIEKNGLDKIKEHAYTFVNQRLKVKLINDGKQTPTHGHPVFIAQHACACCCRSCLYKWHKIDSYHDLTDKEIDYIVNVLMKWIEREVKNDKNRQN